MSKNPEKDALRKAATKQKIIETGFRVFAERTIDAANLKEVAAAGDMAMSTVYFYYNRKEALVLDIGAWVWKQYTDANIHPDIEHSTAAEDYAFFLESFIDLYRNHRDMLRFNQFFNIYVQREGIPAERMRPYNNVIDALAQRFHVCYEKAKIDGTLRTDIPEREMFSRTLHLMLAAVTRYAVGLVYDGGVDPESELIFLRDMMMESARPTNQEMHL